uniref:Calcium-transporting ATPase 9, plasma membrane-type n=1 Tax=Aegilops tauschii TaxID=37682 RepID=N1R223_AEGTA
MELFQHRHLRRQSTDVLGAVHNSIALELMLQITFFNVPATAHLHVDCAQPPAITWQRKFDDEGKKVAMLSMTTDIFTVIPLIFKMLRLHVEGIAKNQVAVYDPLRKWMDNCYRGVPLGGLGLAFSMRKMMRDKALVRRLSACETMGNKF